MAFHMRLSTWLCAVMKMRVLIIIIMFIPLSMATRYMNQAQSKQIYNQEIYKDLNVEPSESAIKDKLVNLLMSTKNDLANKMKRINSIHDVYKSDKMYKIGYLVSSMNKLYQNLSDAYTNIEDHKYRWSTMEILNAYEEVKQSSDYLQKAMRVLNMVASSNLKIIKSADGARLRKTVVKTKSPDRDVLPLSTPPTDKKMEHYDISWSYYDDSMWRNAK